MHDDRRSTKITSSNRILLLVSIAIAAVLVHGYHLGGDDSAIYIPGIEKAAHPGLFPFGSEFFDSHAHLSLFAPLVGSVIRVTHLPSDWVIFVLHVFSVFLLLIAARQLAEHCFESESARWAAVSILAMALTVPVAGTALLIMDPNVTARSLSTPATVFALANYIANKRVQTGIWLTLAAVIHPQMAVYAAGLLVCLAASRYVSSRRTGSLKVSPTGLFAAALFGLQLAPADPTYRQIIDSRRAYFFVTTWSWWEWFGVFAPLLLLWAGSRLKLTGTLPPVPLLSRSLVIFGSAATVAGIVVASNSRFEYFARLQPMRSFHIVYIVMFILIGGLLGQCFFKTNVIRWLLVFLPLGATMLIIQLLMFPASRHIEWPGVQPRNAWISAFFWIRSHTPEKAIFALDPNYMIRPGEDMHGFRAIAERSVLADNIKDSGAVSVFPQLEGDWEDQVDAQRGWRNFKLADFERLHRTYNVTWVILAKPAKARMYCPYQNEEVKVCAIGARPVNRARISLR